VNISFLVMKGLPFAGGIERYMEAVGPRLSARGHDVRVYSISYRTKVPSSYEGMKICTVPALRSKSLEKPSAALLASLRASFDGADVVHVHAFGPSLFGILPRLAGKKVVIQGHGIEWQRSKWGVAGRTFLRFSEWASVHVPHALTVVSRTQKSYLRQRYGIDATFIPPGVTPVSAAPPDEIKKLGLKGGDYILFAARLEREKGLHYLIEAYRKLAPGMKLVVAGDNLLDDTYKREMHALAAGHPGIVFTGFATGRLLQELFSNCYLFVLPSELEGLPIAVLEAMSYGCACLVSDIPESLEAVDGRAVTFRSRDPRDLARQLSHLIDSPKQVKAIGRAARAHVTRSYDWDEVALDLEALYRSVLSGAPHEAREWRRDHRLEPAPAARAAGLRPRREAPAARPRPAPEPPQMPVAQADAH
jgi:glycosyltransferase involved in cell wall biosynthesis